MNRINSSLKANNLGGYLLWLPVLVWLGVIANYSVNVPWFDDFDPFADFLRKWINTRDLGERLSLIISPNNEHRMVFGKLSALIYYFLTGTLNITAMHFAGALFSLGTLWILWKTFKTLSLPWWYFLPLSLLLFQLQPRLVYLWAICSLQHQPVVFFVCLTMYLLAREKKFAWAILAAICASFSMSNGLFVWVGGAAIMAYRSQWRFLGIWIFFTVCTFTAYFSGMATQGNEDSISFFIAKPYLSVLGFFTFLGGLFDFWPHFPIVTRSIVPAVMGLAISVWVFVWLFRITRGWIRNLLISKASDTKTNEPKLSSQVVYFCLGILAFVLTNALIIGFLRPRFGFFVMLVPNYKLYPALFMIGAYLPFLAAVPKAKLKKPFLWVLGLTLAIWSLSAMVYIPDVIQARRDYLANAYNQEHHAFGLGFVPHSSEATYIDRLMHDLEDKNVYKFPNDYTPYIALMQVADNSMTDSTALVVSEVDNGWNILQQSVSFSLRKNDGSFAFLRGGSGLYLFPMPQRNYQGKNPLRRFDQARTGYVPKAAIPPGNYTLGLLEINKGRPSAKIVRELLVKDDATKME